MSTQDRIRARIDSFVSELGDLVRQAALEAIEDALASRRLPPRERRARRTRLGQPPAEETSSDPHTELDRLESDVLDVITLNPGLRIDAIAELVGIPRKEALPPVQRLLMESLVETKGKARSTTYYAV